MIIDITPSMVERLARRHVVLPAGSFFLTGQTRLGRLIHLGSGINTFQNLTVKSFTYSVSQITNSVVEIGRYCSFGSSITFGEMEHATQWLSTSSFVYDPDFIWGAYSKESGRDFSTSPLPGEKKRMGITIGNDVWLGARCYIRGGVSIGHGAIIGANAVVTKDVEPFSIVVGNPGVVKKKRFDDATIERLLAVGWWNYDYTRFERFDFTDVTGCLSRIEDAVAAGRLELFDDDFLTINELQTLAA